MALHQLRDGGFTFQGALTVSFVLEEVLPIVMGLGALVALWWVCVHMRTEAASAGFYQSPGWKKPYPRLQILTIAQLLQGKTIDYPGTNVTFKKAPRARSKQTEDSGLPGIG